MTDRIHQIINHVRGTPLSRLQAKSPDDIVITMALRTPMCKAKKGGFKDMTSDELLLSTLRATIDRIQIPPEQIEDITIGTVLTPGAAYLARAASLAAGFAESTPVQIINRFCSSGLMAISGVANQIKNGDIECGLAIGFEHMTANPDRGIPEGGFSKDVMAHPAAADCVFPMGWTSENVANDFKITREKMDEFALLSHQRASRAQSSGLFQEEIMPLEAYVAISQGNDSTESTKREKKMISVDDGIRHGSTAQQLAKIRPAFPQWPPSHTSGGNASQITDGGAVVLLMSRRKAEELKCKILAKYINTQVVGLPPRIMGIGPSLAIPKLLEKVGLDVEDIDLFEINEAFASMYVYCVQKLQIPLDKVNVNGGAIALGHPLGCTGARQVATGLHELRRRRGKVLVTSMCIGTGMGAAGLILAEY
ncbi:Thiolase, N-terminal domain-containing protein [Melampsora americana]|nr:Thiolase, N-terminal domain-containing protein [Melampsora americana]